MRNSGTAKRATIREAVGRFASRCAVGTVEREAPRGRKKAWPAGDSSYCPGAVRFDSVSVPFNWLLESKFDPPTITPNGEPAVTEMVAVPDTSKPADGVVQQFTGPAL